MNQDYVGLAEKIFTALTSIQNPPCQSEIVQNFFDLRIVADNLGLRLGVNNKESKFELLDIAVKDFTLARADTVNEIFEILDIISMDRRNQEEKRTKEYQREGDTQDVDAV